VVWCQLTGVDKVKLQLPVPAVEKALQPVF